jgi:hypothetical protein
MKHFILSLLLLSGVVAKAQAEWPTEKRGDTTFTFISDYSVIKDFRVKNTWNSYDLGFGYDTMLYEFFVFEENGIVIGAPYQANCAMIEYPMEDHVEKYFDYIETDWFRRKMQRINRARKKDGLKPIGMPRR